MSRSYRRTCGTSQLQSQHRRSQIAPFTRFRFPSGRPKILLVRRRRFMPSALLKRISMLLKADVAFGWIMPVSLYIWLSLELLGYSYTCGERILNYVKVALGTDRVLLFANTLSITHEGTGLYRDLPANIVGSFFMGSVGIVFKKQLLFFSEPLAIGFSTGLMGSITTYAGWNQKMVILLTTGQVAAAISGLLFGMAIAMMSLFVGIDFAEGLKYAVRKFQQYRLDRGLRPCIRPSADNYKRRMVSFALFFCMAGILWAAAVVLWVKARSRRSLRILWLACIVAPPGVWARWHLARLNGQGVRGRLQWLPIGTLAANLIAAGLEAGLGAIQYAVQKEDIHVLIEALQLGFLGCMSTVSTFVAEVYALYPSPKKSKAYKYTFITLTSGLIIGIGLYSCTAWSKGYVHF